MFIESPAWNSGSRLTFTYNLMWSFDLVQIYSEQDTAKMPLELGSALSIEREAVTDPDIRVQALDAIYLLALQVKWLLLFIVQKFICVLYVERLLCKWVSIIQILSLMYLLFRRVVGELYGL